MDNLDRKIVQPCLVGSFSVKEMEKFRIILQQHKPLPYFN